MISRLYLDATPFPGVVPCPSGRSETSFTLFKNGLAYKFVVRDNSIVIEDPYLALVKAEAFAIKHDSPYPGAQPPKQVKDFLIKNPLRV